MPTLAPGGAFRAYRPASPRPDTPASDYVFNGPVCRCPECGDTLTRIRRRGVDHLLSALVPVGRFRCLNLLCAWEGNLRDRPMGISELLNSVGLSAITEHDRR